MANNISFRISAVDDFSRTMRNLERSTNSMTDAIEGSVGQVSQSTTDMARSMRDMHRQMSNRMRAFRTEQLAVEYQFTRLAQNTNTYAGRTNDLMNEIQRLGRVERDVSDNMIRNNERLRVSFYRTVGQMLNMTTQASRVAQNYERMGNPLYNVNQMGLRAADAMNRLANRGNASVLALRLLGPTANMQQLLNMQRMITQGLMRFQMVALGAAIASALVYKALHKGAMETVKGYKEAFNQMKSSVREALQPMVDVFGMVMVKVYNFINAVAQLAIAFNEAHPVLAKIIQGIMMLIPALTLILSPLAIGIGLVAGFTASWGFLWTIIGPVVTGLAAMSATVWLVATALVGIVVGLNYAYTHFVWFRTAVDATWAWIKKAFLTALNFIKGIVRTVMSELSTYFGSELNEIKAFWDENGKAIMTVVKVWLAIVAAQVKTTMAIIKAVFTVAWSAIKGATAGAWGLIKGVISAAIQIILGIIKTFVSILTGDWKGAWEGVKQITRGAIDAIASIIKGTHAIGRNIIMGLINGIESAAGALLSTAKSIANKVTSTIKGALDINSPSRVMMELGGFTTEGLAVGMMHGINKVAAAAGGIANAAVPNSRRGSLAVANDAGMVGSAGSASRNVTVEIPLYIDGREIARATVNDLDSLLAGQARTDIRLKGGKR